MRCVRMMWRKCQTGNKRVVVRKWQGVRWGWWIKSKNEDDGEAKNTKRNDDPLKSNMRWSHINNECNDGKDNDTKLLRESHSSHSQNTWNLNTNNERSRKAHIRALINKHTQWSNPQTSIYMPNDGEYYAHTHVLIFLFFSFSFFSFVLHFHFFFFYIYTNAYTLNHKQMIPKYDIYNG